MGGISITLYLPLKSFDIVLVSVGGLDPISPVSID